MCVCVFTDHYCRYMDLVPMAGNDESLYIELSGMHTTNQWGLTPVRVSEVCHCVCV